MAVLTLSEPVVEERPDNPAVEVVLSLQRQLKFQSVSLEVQQNPVSQPTQDPPNVVDKGISTGILTLDEIMVIKQKNQAKALRKLQQLRQLSNAAQPSSSTVAPSSELDAAATLTLQKLKDLLFEREFLLVLDEEEGLTRDVFNLLDELPLHELPASIVKYFFEFEAFFTQFVKNLNLSRNADFQIKTKLNEIRLEWDFNEACEKKLSDFEAKKKEHLC